MNSNNKPRVVIVDDNTEFLDLLSEFMTQKDMFEVVGTATDGIEAVRVIGKTEPDVVVLDLIMPKLDGLGVLEKASSMGRKTQYIVTSAIGNYKTSQLALSLGAEYFMIKPLDFEALASRIYQLLDIDNEKHISREGKLPQNPDAQNIEKNIEKILKAIGMPDNLKGHGYIKHAAMMIINDLTLINSLTRHVYAQIAALFNSTSARVERAIRNAIEMTWTRGHMESINKLFNYQITDKRTRPTNSEFIMMVVNKILDK
ncbi:MAG: sporulation transcription factor Spo0A [Clostridiales bacterium]|jgi:two-component system response regulator (stage 0 sporulation protein A)|nr:sporulation transcription factor Spo0A [Clostridiales bacterium]